MNYELLTTLLPTILLELGVLWLLREKRARVLWASVAVNILTNVPLNLYVRHARPAIGGMIMAEGIIIGVEMLWYWMFIRDLRLSAIYSLLCNAVSALTGLLAVLVYMLVKNL